ncbi:hypothetical protein AVEN_99387-1 [Araneus ventricosus]|uniref:Uncharacterized protein n=1 Tax=Araneus ventricosus TaxID=182803 RepID=A0A4Y2IM67_ARAVE|nr:hypothetical protein AVEN_99387-1 [Araneus ventricosus]
MNQGFIENLKHFYRCPLVESILIGNFDNKKLSILHASRICKHARNKVSDRTIMICFHKAVFVKKETEGVNVVRNFDEIDPELAVDNWEYVNSDPSILYKDYVSVDQNVVECGESTDADIIAKLAVKNKLRTDNLGMKRTRKYQRSPSTSESIAHIHEL